MQSAPPTTNGIDVLTTNPHLTVCDSRAAPTGDIDRKKNHKPAPKHSPPIAPVTATRGTRKNNGRKSASAESMSRATVATDMVKQNSNRPTVAARSTEPRPLAAKAIDQAATANVGPINTNTNILFILPFL